MISFEQMLLRLGVAMAVGAMMGLEREMVGKEAGIRTAMMVSAGAAIFAMISIIIPYMAQVPPEEIKNTLPDRVLSNIVVGIGFLGAGIIIKTGEHVRGLTTAAFIWTVAAVGTLIGLGLIKFAVTSGLILAGSLYILRLVKVYERVHPDFKQHDQ